MESSEKPKKSKKGKKVTEVQNALSVARTNDDSIVSKRSAARAKYFEDEYLAHFVKKPSKRSALINRGYFIRRHAVVEAVSSFLRLHQEPCQIVSLGAGFDSLFFVAVRGRPNVRFFEVDFQHVVDRKSAIIQHTPELLSLLVEPHFNEHREIESKDYSLLSGDLCQFADLRAKLLRCGVDPAKPVMFLAECVFTYMANADSDRIIYWVATQFAQPWFVTYEQIRPYDAFGRTMRENLHVRGSDLLGVEGYPTRDAQVKRYASLGFEEVRVKTMLEIFLGMDEAERSRIEAMEEFDEVEEWREKCSHYIVAVASKRKGQEGLPFERCSALVEEPRHAGAAPWKEEKIAATGRHADAKRWGHSANALADGRVVVFAGYGGAARHERVNSVLVLDPLEKHSFTPPVVAGLAPCPRVYHGACIIRNNCLLVYGGRSSPASPLGDLHVLDCDSFCWKKLEVAPESMPPRYRHSMVNVPDTSLVVVFGGATYWGKVCNELLVLDHGQGVWRRVQWRGEAPAARMAHAAVWLHGALFVYGGYNQQDDVLADLWRVTFSDNYETAEAVRLDVKLPPRFSHEGVVVDGKMLFVGGCGTSHEDTIVSVDVHSLQSRVQALEMEVFSRTRAVVVSNRVYLVGGGLLCFSFGSSFAESLTALTFGETFVPPVRAAKLKAPILVAPAEAKTREIPRRREPSPQEFREWVANVREPCIFEGCGDVPRWTRQDILDAVPADTLASVHLCGTALLDFSDKNFHFEVMPFAEMLAKLEEKDAYMYFRSLGSNARKDPSNVSETFPALAEKFLVPAFARELVTRDSIHSSCLRFSSRDVQMWTHYDINDNLLCGLRGEKRLVLWHPEEVRHLYPDGTASKVIDVENPDLERFPKFAKAVQWVGTLKEGDVLFIPAMWWHNVRTLSPCYGLNVFFRHLPAEQYQQNDLYGNKDPVPAQNAQKTLQKALESLAELPEEYRNFFARKMVMDVKRFMGNK